MALGLVLLVGTTAVPSIRITENHADGSNGSNGNGTNYELVENHGFLNRRYDPSRRVVLQNPSGGIQSSLKCCPRDARLRRTLLTVSGHELSGHRWANRLLAPLLT